MGYFEELLLYRFGLLVLFVLGLYLGCLCLPSLLLAMFAVIVLCSAGLFLSNGVCMPFGLVGSLFDSRSSNKATNSSKKRYFEAKESVCGFSIFFQRIWKETN